MATMLFNNLITFSRGTNATLTGPTGLIQWAPSNLLTYSEQFDNAAWVKVSTGVTANATTAPDGSATADKFYPTVSDGRIYQTPTTTSASVFSFYVKAGEMTAVNIRAPNNGPAAIAYLDLSTGVVSGVNATYGSAGAVSVGNGWYRFYFALTGTLTNISLAPCDAVGSTVSTPSGTSGIYIWGAQLELGTTATTYNSTTVKNLLGYSEAFDNAAWTKSNVSIVTGAAANPVNGLFNAQKLMEDTANAEHRVLVNSAITTITGVVYGYSVYAKAGERSQLRLTDNNIVGATFTLSGSGATSSVSGGVTASISPLSGGWYRCFISVAAASVSGRLVAYLVSGGATTYTGDGNSGVYIWGAQLSDSGSLDPYVPTPGAAPTSAAYYGPRFDYDPVTLAAKGFLVEEARTNLLTYSEQFDNAAWTKTNATITANATTSPDGTVNADKMVETTAATTRHGINQSYVATAGLFTVSVFAKAAENGFLTLAAGGAGQPNVFTWFNLNTGSVGTNNNSAATMQSLGNGWYRCSITFTAITGVLTPLIEMSKADGVSNYTGDGTSGIYAYGAQLEAGAFATSYIPTVASTVTRSADVATLTGTNFSGWYNQSEGTFVVGADVNGSSATNPALFGATDGTSNNRINPFASGTNWVGYVSVGGVAQASINSAGYSTGTPFKHAIASATNSFNAALNGTLGAEDTSGSLPTGLTQLALGCLISGSLVLNGHIRSITYYPDRASNTQLQSITT